MWSTSKPNRHDYSAVLNELNAAKIFGNGIIFERGPHVPIGHMAYFKPPMDDFAVYLKAKDRRSVKKWEYVNGAGVWLETILASLNLAKEGGDEIDVITHRLSLAEGSLKAALEVLLMRAQYFRDIREHGI